MGKVVRRSKRKVSRASRKVRPFEWYCDLYHMSYLFFINWTEKSFYNYMDKKYPGCLERRSGFSGKTMLLEHKESGKVCVIIWTDETDKKNIYLSHECVHAANMTLDWVGVHPCFKNDEAQAYLVSRLFRAAID